MKTKDFLKEHNACIAGAKWALSIGGDMADVWDAMIEQGKHDWLIWTATRPGVFSDSILRKLACRFVRETPLTDGRKVWDLLTDERSRKAVEVAESYADGKATAQELEDARAAARAAYAAYAARVAHAAAHAAARAAAYAAYADYADYVAVRVAHAAARAAAYAAYADYADYAAVRASACATDATAYAAASSAADDAYAAADAVAKAAQAQMIAELGNPFKKERAKQ